MKFFNNSENNKNINISLNVIKCLAIFAVVCMHCPFFPLETKQYIISDSLMRFSIPIFFLVSGYFSFFNNTEKSLNKYKTRIIRLIKIYALAIFVYLIFNLITNKLVDFNSLNNIFDLLFNFIVFNIPPVGFNLWFIGSLLYCYIIFYLIKKFSINIKVIYYYVPVLLAICLIMGEFSQYFGIIYPVQYYRNFLFFAMPFFILGYYIHDNEKKIISLFSNMILIILIIIGCLLTCIEVLAVGKSDLFIGTIIVSISMFLWCIKYPDKLNLKISAFIGGKLFTYIYILHILVILTIPLNYGILNPFTIFIITTGISYVLYVSFNKIENFTT